MSTPKSSRPACPKRVGSSPTQRALTSPLSTPAASSKRRRRTRSTRCSRPPMRRRAARWSPSGAWRSATAVNLPRRFQKRSSCRSTTTPRSVTGSMTCWPVGRLCRTCRTTAEHCCRSAPSAGPRWSPMSGFPVTPEARGCCGSALMTARPHRSSSRPAVTGGVRSARSRRFAARSCRARRRRFSARRDGWPPTASAKSFLSVRTRRRTERISATSGCSNSCCRRWLRSTASRACG